MRNYLLTFVVVAFGGLTPGCGCNQHPGTDDMLTTDTDGGEDMTAVVAADGGCFTGGNACSTGSECCSGMCDPTMHICTVAACAGNGATCVNPTDCCSLNCSGGTCSSTQCVSDNQPCTVGGNSCCSTQCVNGSCKPLNGGCATAGNACTTDVNCCSGKCNPTSMTCEAPSTISYCTQPGDICFHNNECCTGVCSIAAGATAGTCATINTPCRVDGLTCDGCGGCCSSYCAPFGTGTTKICQPASGCHVLGDLCTKNTDCCGGDEPNGLPGSGLVRCVPDPMYPSIGTCSQANPNNCVNGEPTCKNTCQPEGDVCHYLGNGGCSSNSFPNNCCSAPGNKGLCQLDKLGVPRCFGLGMCVMAGGACASSADCCNGVPCVPDGMGHLVCGATSCVPANGVCTTTADCCSGNVCVIPPGSTKGTCTQPAPPPPGDMAGTTMCSLSGQICSTSTPCCVNNGNCVNPSGGACGPSDTGCFCQLLIGSPPPPGQP
ncbi:MAG: hypothetical protein JWM53_2450 [bacterium]|nr:hypothetical protein [bacterium]